MKTSERILLLAAALVVLWFDVWTVRSSGGAWKFGQKQNDFYNLLIDGWLDGQLAMKVDVPDALLKLADPYDPAQRPPGMGLHDATFYRGKYYLYFGAAPVVTLMLPFRVLTRTDLPQAVAVLVFVYGAFLASATVWLRLRRKYFADASGWVSGLCVLTLGFASLGPVLLRRPHVWELPIASAYCFAMLALLAIFESLHAERRRAAWFAAAGLFVGLAVASRPTYLAATPLLLAPVIWWTRSEGRVPWRVGLCGLATLGGVGVLMALHNLLRFGNPLEFGQSYQFSLDYEAKMRHFSPSYAGFNAWRYFFSSARWSEYFPFISPANLPAKPANFGGHDDVYGVLANLPILWLALAAPLAAWVRTPDERGRLNAWLGAAAVLFAGLTAMLLCYFGSLMRYQMEFTPALVLLACVGVLVVERRARIWPRALRVAACAVWRVAALASVVFAVLFSLQLNRLLEERNPAEFRAVAKILNHVPAWWQRLTGDRPSAWEVEVWLPRRDEPRTETFISIGDAPDVDRVFFRWVNPNHLVLGFAREPMPEILSEPLEVSTLQTHRVRVTLGELLPPDTHPWFARATPDDARLASRLVRLELDGKVVVQTFRRFEHAGGRVRVGPKSLGDAAHPRFTGQFIGATRVPIELRDLGGALAAARELRPTDTFSLKLKFPRERDGACEPLVVTGRSGQGDMLGVEYVADARVRFVFDHWGSQLLRSEPVATDFGAEHEVIVRLPWLTDPSSPRVEVRGELALDLDGAPAWRQSTMGFRADPEEIALAENPIGGSNVGLRFTGAVREARRGRE